MPRLIIDALPLLGEGGISNYLRPFCAELLRQAAPERSAELLFRIGWDARRKKRLAQIQPGELPPHTRRYVTALPDSLLRVLWERGLFVSGLPLKKGDLVIATTELVPRCRNATVGYFIYDIVPLMIPEKYAIDLERYALGIFNRLKNADFVITISETSKHDLVERFRYPERKIVVVYPGCDAEQPAGKDRAAEKPARPYILYMGACSLNKNVDGLIRIFARCVREYGCDVDLVLTGKDFCGEKFWRDLLSAEGVTHRVRFAGWVSDDERAVLLAGAVMLWQFSWYEGFGLPVLEAAAAGIPVLCSNRGSLPEILGNPEQEIDPGDESAAAATAARALASPALLETWAAAGLKRAASFSWERSIAQFISWHKGFDHENKR